MSDPRKKPQCLDELVLEISHLPSARLSGSRESLKVGHWREEGFGSSF